VPSTIAGLSCHCYSIAIAQRHSVPRRNLARLRSTSLRFTFSKCKEIGRLGKERIYVTDTAAENPSKETIGGANLPPYVFDKNNARIGEGYIDRSDVSAGQNGQVSDHACGVEDSRYLESVHSDTAHCVRDRHRELGAVPQGASLRVDGRETGTTPKIVELAAGKHILEFRKDGFNRGKSPLKITPGDASGGSPQRSTGKRRTRYHRVARWLRVVGRFGFR
jgi:PEGA domain